MASLEPVVLANPNHQDDPNFKFKATYRGSAVPSPGSARTDEWLRRARAGMKSYRDRSPRPPISS